MYGGQRFSMTTLGRHYKRLVVSFLLLAGCHMKENANTDLKIHFPKVTLLLDPQLMEDAFSMTVNGQLYRGLYRFTADGDVVPDLVESLTISPDKKTYIFVLKDQKFSDGKSITSDNVRMSFARMFNVGAS